MSKPDLSEFPADHPIHSIPAESFRRGVPDEFQAKLTEDERRAIIALDYKGVHRNVLAAAFGINRRTLASMLNRQSSKYTKLRKAFDSSNPSEWCAKYITEDIALRVAKAKTSPEATIVKQQDYDDREQSEFNRRATKWEGAHTYKSALAGHRYNHVIRIFWHENGSWAYQDTNGFDDTEYPGFKTSTEAWKQACISAMDKEIGDE